MLGAGVSQGRPLLETDDGAVLVLSYEAWRNKFGADPTLLGRTMYVRGQPFEVVGIGSPSFEGVAGVPVGFWIPLNPAAAAKIAGDAFSRSEGVRLIGRLQPGLRPEAARSALLAWVRQFAPEAAGLAMVSHATAIPITRDALVAFLPLFTAFGLVLAIACANVSNMMLARALARQREVAIRVSLGASRARLVRQLLTESLLLALPSAAAGFAISELTIAGARRLLFATAPPAFARFLMIEDLSPDWRVFSFILAASVATALLFGLAPAIQTTRARVVETNRGDFSSDYRPARLRNLLVIGQVAVCGLLLICTVTVLRSIGRVNAQPLGLDIRGVWDVRLIAGQQAKAVKQLATEPGVEAVATAWRAPLYGSPRHLQVAPAGGQQQISASYNLVSADYFRVFRIPVTRGRVFTAAESDSEAAVVVVGESVAKRLWPGQDAVGQTIRIPPPEVRPDPYWTRLPQFSAAQVIGVVKDVMSGVAGNGSEETCFYFPTHAGVYGNLSVLVRMRDAGGARERVEAALDRVAPSLADFLNPMQDVLGIQFYAFRVTSWVAGFLAAVALLMTVSGIYGVLSYLVSQRTKEIGIRVAVGASTANVVWLVARHSGRLAAVGAAGGGGLALAAAPVFAHQLQALQPYDWAPYAATAAVVMGAALGASFGPALRAVRVDPVKALRCD
jgi:predicted permease